MHITTSPRYILMTLCLVGQLLNCSKKTIAGEGFGQSDHVDREIAQNCRLGA